MAAYSLRRGSRNRDLTWPGFVDALATLLMVIIFLLMIFVIAQVFLGFQLSGRDEALKQLNSEIAELADLLSLERSTSESLRGDVATLSQNLESMTAERDDLRVQITSLAGLIDSVTAERDRLSADLTAMAERAEAARAEATRLAVELQASREETAGLTDQLRASEEELRQQALAMAALTEQAELTESERARLEAALAEEQDAQAKLRDEMTAAALAARQERERLEKALEEAQQTIAADKETIELKLADIVKLQNQVTLLEALRDDLQVQIGDMAEMIETERRGKADAEGRLLAEQELSESARAQVALLNQQLAAMRRELAQLNLTLEASERLSEEQKVEIASLGERLNRALASKVEELNRYRSEFFGRLREVLGGQRGIRIAGDRFVFQSEVLFETGSAELGIEGKVQLAAFAETLIEIAGRIPDDLDWILRVDGHTDRVPIATSRYPSNWELSTARSVSVVKHLVEQGVPASRLAATGFGEFQPIDPADDEIAYRRNRRIELKLTQR
jgi:chemotaxis protein MotB